jgi:hypothetical protein
MAVLSVLAATFAVMALGAVLMRRGISPFFALGVFALPAVPTTVYDMMPELLQLGLLTVGLLLWESHPRRHSGWAIAAFSLAALTRESSLLVPLTLIAFELPRIRARPTLSTIRLLTIPFLVYASWITFVYARVGAWPFHSPSGGLTVVPFGGLVRALAHSSDRISTALWFAVGVCMLGGAVLRGRRDAWLGTVIAFAVMAVFMGSTVWQRPDYFGRVLLPLYAYGVLIVASALWERRAFVSLHRARSPARSRVS